MSLLCPPVAAAVKNTAGYTSLSAPNWSRSEFYYPAISRGFHQWLLPVEQFKGGGNQRWEAAGKIWTRLSKNKYAAGFNAAVTIKGGARCFIAFKRVILGERMIGKRAAEHLGMKMVQCYYI